MVKFPQFTDALVKQCNLLTLCLSGKRWSGML